MKIKVIFDRELFMSDDGYGIYSATPYGDSAKSLTTNHYGTISIKGNFSIDALELGKNPYTIEVTEDSKGRRKGTYLLNKIHYIYPTSALEQWEEFRRGYMPLRLYNVFATTFSKDDLILDIIRETGNGKVEIIKGKEQKADRSLEPFIEMRNKAELLYKRAKVFEHFGHITGVDTKTIDAVILLDLGSVDNAIKKVQANPFLLLRTSSIDFVTVDKIRAYLGGAIDSDERILFGIEYLVNKELTGSGDTYLPLPECIPLAQRLLSLEYSAITEKLKKSITEKTLLKEYRLVVFKNSITTESLYFAERCILKNVQQRMAHKEPAVDQGEWDKKIAELVTDSGISPSTEQSEFLKNINKDCIHVLVGAGGSGKTWITKTAYNAFRSFGLSCGLFAPTARAAKVMREYVGADAVTIHKAFMQQASTNKMLKPDERPTYVEDFDVIFLDESSMISSDIMEMVFMAINPRVRVIVIGDSFQLPSVSPGNVLYDFINYLNVPTTQLTKVFRQKEGSGIIEYANAIRDGSFLLNTRLPIVDDKNITFINTSDDDVVKEEALKYYKKAWRKNGEENTMCLSPINGTAVGRNEMNKNIQTIVNPVPQDESKFLLTGDNTCYCVGDYVLTTKNDYEARTIEGEYVPLINGDYGKICRTGYDGVDIDVDSNVFYIDRKSISSLEHAWCTTIHKAQGGQANEVIVMLPQQGMFGLSANMLYTAISRAKEHCYIIGDFHAINRQALKLVNQKRKTILSLYSEPK